MYTAPTESAAIDDCLYDAIGEATVKAAAADAMYDVAENVGAAMNPTVGVGEYMGVDAARPSVRNATYDTAGGAGVESATYNTAAATLEPATYDTAAALLSPIAGTGGSGMAMYDVCGLGANTSTTDDQDLYATADGLYGVANAVDLGPDAMYDSATPASADTEATYAMAEQERLPAFGGFGSTKANLSGTPDFGEQSVMFDSTEDLLATVDAETDGVGVGLENPVYDGGSAKDEFDIVSAAAIMHSSTHSKASQAEKEWTENSQNAFVLDKEATSVRLKSARRVNPLFCNSIALAGGDDDDIAELAAEPLERSKSFENALDTASQEPVGYGQYARAEGDEVMYTPTAATPAMGVRTKSYEGALDVIDNDTAGGALA